MSGLFYTSQKVSLASLNQIFLMAVIFGNDCFKGILCLFVVFCLDITMFENLLQTFLTNMISNVSYFIL